MVDTRRVAGALTESWAEHAHEPRVAGVLTESWAEHTHQPRVAGLVVESWSVLTSSGGGGLKLAGEPIYAGPQRNRRAKVFDL